MRRWFTPLLAALLVSAGQSACVGVIGDAGSGEPHPSDDVSTTNANACTESVPSAQLRRITKTEYKRTIDAAFALGIDPTAAFPPDPIVFGLDNNLEALTVSSTLAREYLDAAETVSASAVASLARLTGCADTLVDTDACVRGFLDAKATILWRRTLTPAERDSLLALFATWKSTPGSDVPTAYRVVIERLLNSPNFLYRPELGVPGDPGQVVALASSELAARLSFLLWGQPPDAALLHAAEAGQLDSDAGLLAQVEKMIADPRSRAAMREFHSRVYSVRLLEGIQKNPDLFPNFTPDLAAAMAEEMLQQTDAAWQSGDMSTLFTSTTTFVNGPLAAFYGIPGVTGSEFQRVATDPTKRRGLLTTAGMMAILAKTNESAPVRRGAFFREQIFCKHLEPPKGMAMKVPAPDPHLTTRQRYAAHRADPVCAGCHNLMDGIGLSFENYDAVGQWRDTENGIPIDSSGELKSTDVDGAFDGAVAMQNKLAASKMAGECYATHLFRWTMGRLEGNADSCTISKITDAYAKHGNNPTELLRALIMSPAFRKVRIPEVSP